MNVMDDLKSSRVTNLSYSNWLIFSAAMETALQKFGKKLIKDRELDRRNYYELMLGRSQRYTTI
jgi:hypothetical protein